MDCDSQDVVEDFKRKFDQVVQKMGARSTSYGNERNLILFIMDKCSHFVSSHVIYDDIKARLVPIFTRYDLEKAEASGKGSIDTMINICLCARNLSFNDFVAFVGALAVDHCHAAEQILLALDEFPTQSQLVRSSTF
ncbi:hypothetical protein EGW08_022565, partial [Elysia chlorotica]